MRFHRALFSFRGRLFGWTPILFKPVSRASRDFLVEVPSCQRPHFMGKLNIPSHWIWAHTSACSALGHRAQVPTSFQLRLGHMGLLSVGTGLSR